MIVHGSNSFDCKVSCNSLYIDQLSLCSCFLVLNEVNMTTLSSTAFSSYLPQINLTQLPRKTEKLQVNVNISEALETATSKLSQHSFDW